MAPGQKLLRAVGAAAHRLDEFRQRMQIPGMVLGIIDAAGSSEVIPFGRTHVRGGTPIAPGTRFQIGSVTKSMVALAVIRAQRAGRCSVDDPIGKHLAWIRPFGLFAEVTLGELMSHTSGLSIGSDEAPGIVPGARRAVRTWTPALRGSYYYSNIGYGLLGLVLESLHGAPLATILSAQVFRPLQMSRSFGEVTRHTMGGGASGHWAGAYDGLRLHSDPVEAAPVEPSQSGSGCVVSTCDDLLKYCRFWLSEGMNAAGERLLDRQDFLTLVSPRVEAEHGWHYGYGLMVAPPNPAMSAPVLPPRVAHSGSMLGFRTYFAADLQCGVGMVLLSNLANDQFGLQLWDLANSAFSEISAAARQAAPSLGKSQVKSSPEVNAFPAGVEGRYLDQATGETWSITSTPAGLTLELRARSSPLELFAPDRFAVAAPDLRAFELSITRDAEGSPTAIEHGNTVAVKVGSPPNPGPAADAEALRCVGVYRSKNPWLPILGVACRANMLYAHVGCEIVAPIIARSPGAYDIPGTPESVEFSNLTDGHYLDVRVGGTWLYR